MAGGIDWEVSAELSDSEGSPDDTEEEITSSYFSNSFPKLQFSKDASYANWDSQIGMAEVISRKGKTWTAIGIVRQGKLLCHIERVMFMVERGALILIDDDGAVFSIDKIYSLVACGKYGCTWECYQAYCHLKKSWLHCWQTSLSLVSEANETSSRLWLFLSSSVYYPESCIPLLTDKPDITIQSNLDSSISNLLQSCYIDESNENLKHNEEDLKFTFDMYLPNAKFRKSCPGTPDFVLCIAREYPPKKGNVQTLKQLCSDIPIKFASVEIGRVCFFSFDSAELPVLP